MKKIMYVLALVTSAAGNLCAQERTKSEELFDIPDSWFHRKFVIDLGKGNKMQLEARDMGDLQRMSNVDSIIRSFLHDIAPLKDSLADELTAKRIDYIPDSTGQKKIRFQQFKSKGSTFLVSDGDMNGLKLEQDTVYITCAVHYTAKYTLRKAFPDTRYYRISFFINRIQELGGYLDKGLGEKVKAIQNANYSRWSQGGDGMFHSNVDKTITAKQPYGYKGGGGDYLSLYIAVNMENYKNYFVPSVSLGAKFIFTTGGFFKREIGITRDFYFNFERDNQGKLQTNINHFVTLSWAQGGIRDNDARKESQMLFYMSAGYLVKRNGEFFDKNTWHIGAGRLSLLGGKLKMEPGIYFHDFFRGVTPNIKLTVNF
jgi:hypothetical protein